MQIITKLKYSVVKINNIKKIIIEKIKFGFIKLRVISLFIVKKENKIDKVQIKKFKNSFTKPFFKPISDVVKIKIRIIQSI